MYLFTKKYIDVFQMHLFVLKVFVGLHVFCIYLTCVLCIFILFYLP